MSNGSIIICDGEPGLAGSFADYVNEQQRCQWHVKRDFYHVMHADGAKMEEIKPPQDALAVAMAIELPAGDLQKVPEEIKQIVPVSGKTLLLEVPKKSRNLILAMEYQPKDLAAGRI